MNPGPELLPAVDVAGGRAAQVVGAGEHDPYAVALGWVHEGAGWLHLVDLDRAFGRGDNAALLREVVDAVPVPVQLSGGIAGPAALEWALTSGAGRVVLSSSALAHADWVAEVARLHLDRVAIGVDVRGEEVVARGTSTRVGPLEEVLQLLTEMAPVTLVVADASRDGTRTGADLPLFERILGRVPGPVIASGGVASLDDVRRLAALGLQGIVLGSALYHGTFTLAQARLAVDGTA